MPKRTLDLVRQGLTIFGAIFQIVAGAVTATQVGRLANDLESTILPAGYAFTIWTPIFLLSATYAVWQALPANRENLLARRAGWLIAAGLIGNGIWELLFPQEQYLLSQVVIAAILGVLVLAYIQINREARERALTTPERWLIAMPLGLYFGWITAATCAGMASTLMAYGIADAGSAATIAGVVLLAVGGTIAITMLRAGRFGPRECWLAYAFSVVWALIAITVRQLEPSPITAGLAVAIAVLVAAVVVWQIGLPAASRRMNPSPT